jgi:plastocyanin
LPEGFPTTLSGDYTQAQQAAYIDGLFYVADYAKDKVICVDTAGVVTDPNIPTLNHGICRDDAANLILHTSADVKVPTQLTVYKPDDTTPYIIDIKLNNNGQTNFPTASGDIFSDAGGYVYFFPNGQNFVEVVKIAGGKYVSTTSCAVSLTGSTAGYVIPIDNDPNHFIYQVRANGYHLYKNGDKGSYLTTPNGTTAPSRNNSVGGALFELNGHKMFVYMSGSHYKGGWTIRDMTSAELTPMYTQPQLGDGGYYANASVGAFFHWERIDSVTVNLYEYCLGHGVAGWEISTVPHRIRLKDMTLSPNEITISAGDTATITAVLTPANADIQNTTWRYATTNRNSELKTDGTTAKFTSTKEGTYTVTAIIDDFTATCTINVVKDTNTNVYSLESPCQIGKYVQNGQLLIKNGGMVINCLGQTVK